MLKLEAERLRREASRPTAAAAFCRPCRRRFAASCCQWRVSSFGRRCSLQGARGHVRPRQMAPQRRDANQSAVGLRRCGARR